MFSLDCLMNARETDAQVASGKLHTDEITVSSASDSGNGAGMGSTGEASILSENGQQRSAERRESFEVNHSQTSLFIANTCRRSHPSIEFRGEAKP